MRLLFPADGNTEKYAGPLTSSCIPKNGIMPNSFVNMASVQTYSYRNGEDTWSQRMHAQPAVLLAANHHDEGMIPLTASGGSLHASICPMFGSHV